MHTHDGQSTPGAASPAETMLSAGEASVQIDGCFGVQAVIPLLPVVPWRVPIPRSETSDEAVGHKRKRALSVPVVGGPTRQDITMEAPRAPRAAKEESRGRSISRGRRPQHSPTRSRSRTGDGNEAGVQGGGGQTPRATTACSSQRVRGFSVARDRPLVPLLALCDR